MHEHRYICSQGAMSSKYNPAQPTCSDGGLVEGHGAEGHMVSRAHEERNHMGVEHALDWLPIYVGY